jgi:hypothetical protein
MEQPWLRVPRSPKSERLSEHSVVITPAHKRQQQPGAKNRNESGNRRISMSPDPPLFSLPAYGKRQGSGKVVAEFKPSQVQAANIVPAASRRSQPKCIIAKDFPTNVPEPYRHMFTVLDERAGQLDEQLQDKHDAFCGA